MAAGHEAAPDRIEWLVDNARTYDALLETIDGATTTIWITQLALDADCVAHASAARRADASLIDALIGAEQRGVTVRVLLNASLLLDTARPLRAHLARRGSRIAVRGVSRFPQLLHAKMLIADGEVAYLVGSPFVNGYWDDSRHVPVDTRRPVRELGGRPLHDVSVRITGSAVAGLADYCRALWAEMSEHDAPEAEDGGLPSGRGAPRLVRTSARGMFATEPCGHTEILGALLDGIGHARSVVYIEHQYLSARPVVDALVRALDREPTLELIVLLNQNPDITAYRQWQNTRLRDAGLLDHSRVGLFSLWTADESNGSGLRAVNQVFVHSKVVTVDDHWATVGSANLDGVSLHSYGDDFSSRLGRRIFRHVRNFDVNVVVDERGDDERHDVRDLRDRLWREHLGRSLAGVGLDAPPSGGWLRFWRDTAARNARVLRDGNPGPQSTFILPYSTSATPADQLRDAGIQLDACRLDLRFTPGWLEIHASPNWVRNMFP